MVLLAEHVVEPRVVQRGKDIMELGELEVCKYGVERKE